MRHGNQKEHVQVNRYSKSRKSKHTHNDSLRVYIHKITLITMKLVGLFRNSSDVIKSFILMFHKIFIKG
uniref:Uncharacterized protein n=1 Tax=Rhizophora mucronata TaxID=61149 RepID=A0A2P2PGU1_RHIMU